MSSRSFLSRSAAASGWSSISWPCTGNGRHMLLSSGAASGLRTNPASAQVKNQMGRTSYGRRTLIGALVAPFVNSSATDVENLTDQLRPKLQEGLLDRRWRKKRCQIQLRDAH